MPSDEARTALKARQLLFKRIRGVDLHSHIVGPTVNAARRLVPNRLPGTVETGRLYAGLGYVVEREEANERGVAVHMCKAASVG